MKKFVCFIFALVLSLSMAGCAANTSNASSAATSTVEKEKHDISVDWSFALQGDNGGIDTVGLYVWDPNPNQYDFWKACGYNTLQFCDRSWYWNADAAGYTNYLNNMQKGIEQAKAAGFKVYMILFSNILQYYGPSATEPTGLGIKFHPDDEVLLQQRLSELETVLPYMTQVDGFTIVAGDPGGITDSMGEGDVYDFILLAKEMIRVINQTLPSAEVNINTWAVSMYQTPNVSAATADFWLRETELCKTLFNESDLFGEKVGLELACHDYYRPLTLSSYLTLPSWQIPEQKFPTVTDVNALKAKGTNRLWAWPYFLLDEADDGHVGVERTTLPQFESRYICDYVTQIRQAGFNGAIGNWSYAGYQTKMFNLYAFARACNDQSVTSEQLLREFSCAIATPETRSALVEVFKYIENDSNFAKKTPSIFRQKDYAVSLMSDQEALDLLKTVKPNLNNQFPLPYTPEEYLADLKARLEWSMQL